jgi:DNA polymerase type B, organellar and viral
MLTESLEILASNFNIKEKKSIYPYNFVNDKFNTNAMQNIITNYIGPVPSLNYFPDNIDSKEFIKYLLSFSAGSGSDWNLKNETIKYCENDCIVLYKVLENFNKFICFALELFKLNIHDYPTLPSLAFAIFRAVYLKEPAGHIPLITGQIYKDIKEAYFGVRSKAY